MHILLGIDEQMKDLKALFFIFLLVKFVSGVSYICKPSKSLCLNPKEKVWIRNY